jgi:fatty acid desaturase
MTLAVDSSGLKKRVLADKTPKAEDSDSDSTKDSDTTAPLNEAFWYIHGNAYDLSSYVKSHPGGEIAITLGRGRDCTAMFESYHPFTDRHRRVLKSYAVKKPKSGAVELPPIDEFYEVLSTRVRAALDAARCGTGNGKYKANYMRLAWYALVFSVQVASWFSYVRGSIIGTIAFGTASWLMGGLGHDSSHMAMSKMPWLNHIGTNLGMCFIAEPAMWYHQHTYAHHSHTNDGENDPDMHHCFWFRLTEVTKHWSVHRLQASRLYTYLTWSVTAFGDSTVVPIKSLLTGKISATTGLFLGVSSPHGSTTLGGLPYIMHVLVHNSIYSALLFAPLFTVGGWQAAIQIVIVIALTGWMFGFFSQINHCNEHAHKGAAEYDENGKARGWAMRQVETSTNWANASTFWTLFSNHLNYQIEHHLFPGVNHCYLHIIAPVVRDTCKEHGVKYDAHESFFTALAATAECMMGLSLPSEGLCSRRKTTSEKKVGDEVDTQLGM